jgi:hypothetical protein
MHGDELEPEPECAGPEQGRQGWLWWGGGGSSGPSLGGSSSTNSASTALFRAGSAVTAPEVARGLDPQRVLSLFWGSPAHRGESGCVPVLKRGWEGRVHSEAARDALRALSATDIATAWCEEAEQGGGIPAEQLWVRGRSVAASKFLDFQWTAQDGSGWRVSCAAEAVDIGCDDVSPAGASTGAVAVAAAEAAAAAEMEAHADAGRSGSSRERSTPGVESAAIGTAWRRAKKIPPNHRWKAHALANVYHTQLRLAKHDTEGSVQLHMYRHGVGGYSKDEPTEEIRRQASMQLRRLLMHAAHQQEQARKPKRAVSVNLMDHTLEKDMIIAQHVAWNELLKAGSGSPFQREHFCELQLPCNTDQAVLGGKLDYQRNLNDAAVLRFLDWIREDVCLLIDRMLSPRGLDTPTNRAGTARWAEIAATERPGWLGTLRKACSMDVGAVTATVSKIGSPLHPDYVKFIHEPIMRMEAGEGQSTGWVLLAQQLRDWVATASREAERTALLCHEEDGGVGTGPMTLRHFVHCVLLLFSTLLELLHSFATVISDDAPEGDVATTALLLRELERSRVAVHLLNVFVLAELGHPAASTDASDGAVPPWLQMMDRGSKHHGLSSSRRHPFSRTTSLAVCTLLSHVLGCVVLTNCKSGVDRTGLFSGMQLAISSLWELYPARRWDICLLAINFHMVRGHAADQSAEGHFAQPVTATAADLAEHATTIFCDYFERPPQFRSVCPDPAPAANAHPLAGVVLVTAPMELHKLCPLLCTLRNAILVYLADVNARISHCSCGVRGMKYKQHSVAGQLLPPNIGVSKVDGGDEPDLALNADSVDVLPLTVRKWAGIKTLYGSKGTIEVLTAMGEQLLVDAAGSRKS